MGLLQKIIDVRGNRRSGKQTVALQETQGVLCYNALCSNAENVFAQARPLIDELKMVQPYGIGRNGARLPLARTPELAALHSPNEAMGWAEFADLMFSTWLTEKELNVHVWQNQRGEVYGYTVLPVNARYILGGKDYFRVTLADGTQEELTSDEVMTLRFSRNPRSIDTGVSPGIASMIWSQIDDVLAQYQLGHFENGAVPAYITIIRASTKQRYLDKRKEMENGFHGARNKGKTLFLWRQMLDDGSEKDEVEVKTIQGSNASLAIKEVMSIVNDKLNKAFGVSDFILGNDSSAKYDNAELSQQQFMSHRVYPALYTFWSQFQHELDRILGGLGYAIQFDLEIPELTDRMKVKAETEKVKAETAKVADDRAKVQEETRKLQLENLTAAMENGAKPESALRALRLGSEWKDIAADIYDAQPKATIEALVPTTPALSQDMHICHDCHHTHDAKEEYEANFTEDEKTEKAIYDELIRIIQSVVNETLGDGAVLSEKDVEKIRDLIVAKLVEMATDGANDGAKQIQALALGATSEEIAGVLKDGGYQLSPEFEERLKNRTETLISRLQDDAKAKAEEVLNTEREVPVTAAEIRKELSTVLPKWRAATIARNETVYAFRAGHLENDKNIAQKYGLKLRKIWRVTHDDRACEICRAMDGHTVELDSAFPDNVTNDDGVAYAWERNEWNEDGEIPSAHVNCRCHFETEVIDG